MTTNRDTSSALARFLPAALFCVSSAFGLAVQVGPATADDNTCVDAFDGFCDDGGPGSDFSICPLGTDLADCGPRGGGGGGGGGAVPFENSCVDAFDGFCDDGRPGADFSICPLGSDTFDCGPVPTRGGPTPGFANSCVDAFDGFCDDGRPGADFNICPLGSDTADCGPVPVRPPSIPSTAEGVQIQTQLNFFGFAAGTVDGQIGAGTRAAIERFQAFVGFPINGRNFTSDQSGLLNQAFLWATQRRGQAQTGLSGQALLRAFLNGAASGGPTTAPPPAAPRPTTPAAPPGGSFGGRAAPTVCPTPQTSDGFFLSYADFEVAAFLDAQGNTINWVSFSDGYTYDVSYLPIGLMTSIWDTDASGARIPGSSQMVTYSDTPTAPPLPTAGAFWSGLETASFEDGSQEVFSTTVRVDQMGQELLGPCSYRFLPITITRANTATGDIYTEYFVHLPDFGLAVYAGYSDGTPDGAFFENPTAVAVRPDDGVNPVGVAAPTTGATPLAPRAPRAPGGGGGASPPTVKP